MTAMLRAKLILHALILMLFGITVFCATLGMENLQFMPTPDISFAGTPDYKMAALLFLLAVISQTLTLKLVFDPRSVPQVSGQAA